jgi:GH25 family lysozyme M1 (1,4-beta-N-acetylmuramidase)
MKNSGITFGIARGYCSFGGVDQHVIQSLTNMKEAGLQASTYMFPCRGKDPIAQVNEMLDHIPANLYKNIWIDVETNPSPGCSWSGHNSTSNCQFLTAIIKELKTKGKSVGIYASKYMWSTIFGSVGFCP